MICDPDMDNLVKIHKKYRKVTIVQDPGIKLTPQDRNVIENLYRKDASYIHMGISLLRNPEC